jgi:hypothetical protein
VGVTPVGGNITDATKNADPKRHPENGYVTEGCVTRNLVTNGKINMSAYKDVSARLKFKMYPLYVLGAGKRLVKV